jgi:hypothetical protein
VNEEVEDSPTALREDMINCSFCLHLHYVTIPRKAFLEEDNQCGHVAKNDNFFFFYEHGLVPYFSFN